MRRLNDKQFYWMIGITIFAIITFLAYQDTLGLAMFQKVGGYSGDIHATMQTDYMNLFWTFAFALIAGVSLMFYYLRRDISESVAIFAGTWMMLWSGLEDIIYYWMLGQPGLDASMPWLYPHILGWTSKYLLQLDTVTPFGLYLQLALGTILTYFVIKWLRKQNNLFGVKI